MVTRTTQEDANFGERLKYARIKAKKSQGKLAEEVGLTFQQIQKYEKGLNRISASRLLEFAKILGVSVDFFYRRDDIFSSNAALAENVKKNFKYDDESNEDESQENEKSQPTRRSKKNILENKNQDSLEDLYEKTLLDLFKKVSKPELKEKIINLIRSIVEIN
jgi:transcriptional regulator with XRE-family HTH domain